MAVPRNVRDTAMPAVSMSCILTLTPYFHPVNKDQTSRPGYLRN